MAKIGISEAFRKYDAVLNNVNWSVSAINKKNELVVSLWEHHRDKCVKDVLVFSDLFSRWGGPGNAEFKRNVVEAYEKGMTVRLVIVAAERPDLVEEGKDASTIKKSFRVRPDLIGKVDSIEDDRYTISFVKV